MPQPPSIIYASRLQDAWAHEMDLVRHGFDIDLKGLISGGGWLSELCDEWGDNLHGRLLAAGYVLRFGSPRARELVAVALQAKLTDEEADLVCGFLCRRIDRDMETLDVFGVTSEGAARNRQDYASYLAAFHAVKDRSAAALKCWAVFRQSLVYLDELACKHPLEAFALGEEHFALAIAEYVGEPCVPWWLERAVPPAANDDA